MLDERFGTSIIGGPETVRQGLDELLAATGANEIMVTTMVHDPADRRRVLHAARRAGGAAAGSRAGERPARRRKRLKSAGSEVPARGRLTDVTSAQTSPTSTTTATPPAPAVPSRRSRWTATRRALMARLAARDPGWRRARRALRATCGAAGALAINSGIASAAGQATGVALLGAVVAMVSGLSVTEDDRRQAGLTFLTLPFIGAVSVAVGASLSTHRFVADAVFVVIVFAATGLRRRGPRWSAGGFLAFMTYFFSQFLHALPAQVPWLALSATVGVAVAALLRLVLLPERPQSTLRHLLQALNGQTATLLDAAVQVLEAPDLPARLRRRVVAASGDLNRVALLVEQQLGVGVRGRESEAGRGRQPKVEPLRDGVFMLEVAAAHTVSAVRAAVREGLSVSRPRRVHPGDHRDDSRHPQRTGTADPGPLGRDHPGGGRDSLPRARPVPQPTPPFRRRRGTARGVPPVLALPGRPTSGGRWRSSPTPPRPCRRATRRAPLDVWSDGTTTDSAADSAEAAAREQAEDDREPAGSACGRERRPPSRSHWPSGQASCSPPPAGTGRRSPPTSSSSAPTPGSPPSVGRSRGRPAPSAVSCSGSGSPRRSRAASPPCSQCSSCSSSRRWWLQPVSFFASSVAVTVVLALLYVLLGTYSWQVLLLRMEETLIGAVLGGLVALVLVPARSSPLVRDAEADMLDRLADLLHAVRRRTGSGSALRELDTAFQDGPGRGPTVSQGVPGAAARRIEQRVYALSAAAYSARMLVTALLRVPETGELTDRLEQLTARTEKLAARAHDGVEDLSSLADEKTGSHPAHAHPSSGPADDQDRARMHARVALERLDLALSRWCDPLRPPIAGESSSASAASAVAAEADADSHAAADAADGPTSVPGAARTPAGLPTR